MQDLIDSVISQYHQVVWTIAQCEAKGNIISSRLYAERDECVEFLSEAFSEFDVEANTIIHLH
jgi:hypothetical protein